MVIAIHNLSAGERLALIEELWDSLDAEDVPLTDVQRRELDHRLASADEDAKNGLSWDEVKATLGRRRG